MSGVCSDLWGKWCGQGASYRTTWMYRAFLCFTLSGAVVAVFWSTAFVTVAFPSTPQGCEKTCAENCQQELQRESDMYTIIMLGSGVFNVGLMCLYALLFYAQVSKMLVVKGLCLSAQKALQTSIVYPGVSTDTVYDNVKRVVNNHCADQKYSFKWCHIVWVLQFMVLVGGMCVPVRMDPAWSSTYVCEECTTHNCTLLYAPLSDTPKMYTSYLVGILTPVVHGVCLLSFVAMVWDIRRQRSDGVTSVPDVRTGTVLWRLCEDGVNDSDILNAVVGTCFTGCNVLDAPPRLGSPVQTPAGVYTTLLSRLVSRDIIEGKETVVYWTTHLKTLQSNLDHGCPECMLRTIQVTVGPDGEYGYVPHSGVIYIPVADVGAASYFKIGATEYTLVTPSGGWIARNEADGLTWTREVPPGTRHTLLGVPPTPYFPARPGTVLEAVERLLHERPLSSRDIQQAVSGHHFTGCKLMSVPPIDGSVATRPDSVIYAVFNACCARDGGVAPRLVIPDVGTLDYSCPSCAAQEAREERGGDTRIFLIPPQRGDFECWFTRYTRVHAESKDSETYYSGTSYVTWGGVVFSPETTVQFTSNDGATYTRVRRDGWIESKLDSSHWVTHCPLRDIRDVHDVVNRVDKGPKYFVCPRPTLGAGMTTPSDPKWDKTVNDIHIHGIEEANPTDPTSSKHVRPRLYEVDLGVPHPHDEALSNVVRRIQDAFMKYCADTRMMPLYLNSITPVFYRLGEWSVEWEVVEVEGEVVIRSVDVDTRVPAGTQLKTELWIAQVVESQR